MGGGDLPGRGWGPGVAADCSSVPPGGRALPGARFTSTGSAPTLGKALSSPVHYSLVVGAGVGWSSSSIVGVGAGDKTQYAPLRTRGGGL